MKILILSAQPPAPYSGGEIRLLNLIKNLSDRHEFTVLAPVHNLKDPSVIYANSVCDFRPVLIPPTKAAANSKMYYFFTAWRDAFLDEKPFLARVFYSQVVQGEINDYLAKNSFDIIQAQQLTMAQYMPPSVKSPTVLDVDNLWTKLVPRLEFSRPAGRASRKLIQRLDQNKIRRYEFNLINRFDACLLVSSEEELAVKAAYPGKLIALVPNGVDFEKYSMQPSDQRLGNNIVFTGTMKWEPNSQAVLYFVEKIFPHIRNRFPDVHFQIIGRDPPAAIIELAKDPNIFVTGFVEDIRPYIAGAKVFIVPLLAGAGTRLKILEAFAMSKAVVSTSIGAEGLGALHGKHLMIADDPEDFGTKIIELLENPDLRQKLGENGYYLAKAKFDWKLISNQLNQVYETLC